MKWFKLALIVTLAVTLTVAANSAQASRIFVSTTSTSPALINPTLTLSAGGTGTLYLFWQPTEEQVATDPDNEGADVFQNEILNTMGHDINSTNAAVLNRTAYTYLNPTAAGQPRWGSTGTGSGTDLVDDATAVKVGGSSLGFVTGTAQGMFTVSGSQVWRLSTVTFTATATGTTSIFLGVGQAGIAYQDSTQPGAQAHSPANVRNINFGFLDNAISSNSFGSTTTIADATVVVVPEPGTLAMLGMGVVGLVAIARRRRRSA